MPLQLLAISGPDKGRVFPINEGCAQNVGRSHTHTEITLQDTDIARIQCQVALDGELLVVTDLDGTSSTFVNDTVINEHRMKPGDVLRIGKSQLRLQKEGDARSVPVAGPRPIPVPTVRPVPVSAPRVPIVMPRPIPQVATAAVGLPGRLEELTGTTLGHFEIGPALGKGHTGIVFRARDIKSLRNVALRVLPPEFPKNDAERERDRKSVV